MLGGDAPSCSNGYIRFSCIKTTEAKRKIKTGTLENVIENHLKDRHARRRKTTAVQIKKAGTTKKRTESVNAVGPS